MAAYSTLTLKDVITASAVPDNQADRWCVGTSSRYDAGDVRNFHSRELSPYQPRDVAFLTMVLDCLGEVYPDLRISHVRVLQDEDLAADYDGEYFLCEIETH